MAIRINLFHPNFLLATQRFNLYKSTPTFSNFTTKISCSTIPLNDSDLAIDFANEVQKMNTQQVIKDKAMEKSREILFKEICKVFDMNENDLKKKWVDMNDDEKLVFVNGFVNDWGDLFKPLSIRCVMDMVDEYLDEEFSGLESSSFSGFKNFWGF